MDIADQGEVICDAKSTDQRIVRQLIA